MIKLCVAVPSLDPRMRVITELNLIGRSSSMRNEQGDRQHRNDKFSIVETLSMDLNAT